MILINVFDMMYGLPLAGILTLPFYKVRHYMDNPGTMISLTAHPTNSLSTWIMHGENGTMLIVQ